MGVGLLDQVVDADEGVVRAIGAESDGAQAQAKGQRGENSPETDHREERLLQVAQSGQ